MNICGESLPGKGSVSTKAFEGAAATTGGGGNELGGKEGVNQTSDIGI